MMHALAASAAACALLFSHAVQARTTLFFSENASIVFDDASSYTPQLGSVQDYAPVSGEVVFIDTICDDWVVVPAGKIIAFSSYNCDVGKTLLFLRSAGVVAAIELYGAHQSQSPYDAPPRYSWNPNPPIIMNRIHSGGASQALALLLAFPDNLSATLEFTVSPWSTLYKSWEWNVLYEGLLLAFFGAFIISHGVWSLVVTHRRKRATPHYDSSFTLTETLMAFSILLGVFYLFSEASSMVRELAGIWIPESFVRLMYAYSYVVMLLSVLLLIMYWSDVLESSAVRVGNIQRVNLRIFVVIAVVAFGLFTLIPLLYCYRYPYWQQVWDAGLAALGFVAFTESLFAIFFGWRIVRVLTGDGQVTATRRRQPSALSSSKEYSESATTANAGNARVSTTAGSSPRASITELADIDARLRKNARRRAAPMTRLVIVIGGVLLCVCAVALASGLSPVISTVDGYFAILEALAVLSVALYGLIIFTVSPVLHNACRCRRFALRARCCEQFEQVR